MIQHPLLQKEHVSKKKLREKILNRDAIVAVIGVGYVGLSLATQLAKADYKVLAIDEDQKKVKQINTGNSYIEDVSSEELNELVLQGKIIGVENYDMLAIADIIIICVPTPLTINREPNTSYIVDAVNKIAKFIHPEQMIILESTTYPGTTEEIILKSLETTGLIVGVDYFLAHSPERVDFGNKEHTRLNVPKIVGGITPSCNELSVLFYEQIVTVVPVSSAKIAEMAKVFENTYRCVNIALVNEMAMLCDRMGINVWEMLDAAFTKPFGIHPFYPGPGVGGHCVPVDPFYLSWKAQEHNFMLKTIEVAGEINTSMPTFVVEKVSKALNSVGKKLENANILILGVSFKKDISDYRESPALNIIEILKNSKAHVVYHDPFVPIIQVNNINSEVMYSVELSNNNLCNMDVVIIATDHSVFNYQDIVASCSLVVDTKNATKFVQTSREKIILL